MKKFFLIVLILMGFNLYADPAVRFTEIMRWFGKSDGDVISAGGVLTSETDLSAFPLGIRIMRTYILRKEYGAYAFTINDGRVRHVQFSNPVIADVEENRDHPGAGRIHYRTESEFRDDAERIRHLVQSLNGRLVSDNTSFGANTRHYKIFIERTFEVDIFVHTFIQNRAQNHFGFFQIKAAAIN